MHVREWQVVSQGREGRRDNPVPTTTFFTATHALMPLHQHSASTCRQVQAYWQGPPRPSRETSPSAASPPLQTHKALVNTYSCRTLNSHHSTQHTLTHLYLSTRKGPMPLRSISPYSPSSGFQHQRPSGSGGRTYSSPEGDCWLLCCWTLCAWPPAGDQVVASLLLLVMLVLADAPGGGGCVVDGGTTRQMPPGPCSPANCAASCCDCCC